MVQVLLGIHCKAHQLYLITIVSSGHPANIKFRHITFEDVDNMPSRSQSSFELGFYISTTLFRDIKLAPQLIKDGDGVLQTGTRGFSLV